MTYSYLPRDITFDRPTTEWAALHYQELQRGEWPGGIPSDYTELPGGKAHAHAPFENACLVAAELGIRIKRCGLDGFLAEEKYIKGLEEAEIAKARYLDIGEVFSRINKVLGYCASGRKARWITTKKKKGQTYQEWRRNRGWRRNQ